MREGFFWLAVFCPCLVRLEFACYAQREYHSYGDLGYIRCFTQYRTRTREKGRDWTVYNTPEYTPNDPLSPARSQLPK